MQKVKYFYSAALLALLVCAGINCAEEKGRGELESLELIQSYTKSQLSMAFQTAAVPVSPEYGVDIYKIVYKTVDPDDDSIKPGGFQFRSEMPASTRFEVSAGKRRFENGLPAVKRLRSRSCQRACDENDLVLLTQRISPGLEIAIEQSNPESASTDEIMN